MNNDNVQQLTKEIARLNRQLAWRLGKIEDLEVELKIAKTKVADFQAKIAEYQDQLIIERCKSM